MVLTKDSGWAWMVLGFGILAHGICVGSMLTFGIYFVEFLRTFESSKALTALVGSVAYGVMLGSASLGGILDSHFGSRIVVISGGLLSAIAYIIASFATTIAVLTIAYGLIGLGYGLLIPSILGQQAIWFERYLHFSVGIVTTGGALMTFIMPSIIHASISAYSWRGAMFINSAISLHLCVCGAAFFPVAKKSENMKKSNCNCATSCKPLIWLLAVVYFLAFGNFYVYFAMLNAFTTRRSLSSEQAVILLSVNAICSFVGRLCTAFLGRLLGKHTILFGCATILVTSILTGLIPLCHSFAPFVILNVWHGLAFGALLAGQGLVILSLSGQKSFVIAIGISLTGGGAGVFLLPVAAGALVDYTGQLESAFYLAAAVGIAAAAILFVVHIFQVLRTNTAHTEMELSLLN